MAGMSAAAIASGASADMEALGSAQAGAVVQTCPKVKLEIGVFFDGTGNNEKNAQTGGAKDSYANARSNVSLLKDLYYNNGKRYDIPNACGDYERRYRSLYVQGIGTEADEEDDFWGSAMGVGERGVENRVIQAALEVGRMITDLSKGVEPEEVILDVFGFSRGAAAARHFVNGFNAGRLDYTRWGLFNDVHAKLPEGRNVTIRFLGIFDTVAAIAGGIPSDNWDVNVHLKDGSAETIYHLTANDELRKSFSLNDTANASGSANAGEVVRMPGCHSNIGGGYPAGFKEEPIIKRPDTGMGTTRADAVAKQRTLVAAMRAKSGADAAVFVAEGWLTAADVPTSWSVEGGPIETVHVPGSMFSPGSTYYSYAVETRMKRPWVSHELSRIALEKMYQKASASGLPLKDFPTTGDYEIRDAVRSASAATLKRDYTYHSANYNDIHWTGVAPMEEAPNRRRIVHANDPSKAK